MNDIEKFKKIKTVFQIVTLTLAIVLLVCVIVIAATNKEFNTACIVVLSVFAGYSLTVIVASVFLDKRRRQLIEKYFGTVFAADKQKSKDLIKQIDIINNNNYSFTSDEEFEYDIKTLKFNLRQISKGYKVCRDSVSIYFDIQEAITSAPEKDLEENRDFNNYINELTALFERNISDI